jgi:hypothetical protein
MVTITTPAGIALPRHCVVVALVMLWSVIACGQADAGVLRGELDCQLSPEALVGTVGLALVDNQLPADDQDLPGGPSKFKSDSGGGLATSPNSTLDLPVQATFAPWAYSCRWDYAIWIYFQEHLAIENPIADGLFRPPQQNV